MSEQDAFAIAAREALAPIERGIRLLDRDIVWGDPARGDEYFDSILEGRKGVEDFRVHVKILPSFDTSQLQGVSDYAEAVMEGTAGLRRLRHEYLLVVREIAEAGSVEEQVRAFNQRRWKEVSGRTPRACIALASLDDEMPRTPGVEEPTPDLRRLDLFRILAEATSPGTSRPALPEAGAEVPAPSPGAPPVPVLVVDDDPLVRAMAGDVLEEEGFDVHRASDWVSFRRVLFDVRVGVILLDVNLPGLSGDKLALVASMVPAPKPRVILYSGIEEGELRRRAEQVRAISYLPKDGDLDRMVATVRRAAADFRREAEA